MKCLCFRCFYIVLCLDGYSMRKLSEAQWVIVIVYWLFGVSRTWVSYPLYLTIAVVVVDFVVAFVIVYVLSYIYSYVREGLAE